MVDEGRILGSEEFVDATIHRIGETKPSAQMDSNDGAKATATFEAERLIGVIEKLCGVPRGDLCGPGKSARAVLAKEILVLTGRQLGASMRLLSQVTGLSSGSVSRRHDAARVKMRKRREVNMLVTRVLKEYNECQN